MSIIRPFFRRAGAKFLLSRLLPEPLEGLPIIEPFAGSAGYSLRYGADREVLLIDRNPGVVAIWDYLLGASQADVLALPIVADFGRSDVRELGLALGPMLLIQSWFTPQGSPSNYRVTPRALEWQHVKPEATWTASVRARVARQLPLISKWRIQQGDYSSAPAVEATWAIDPPYQGEKICKAHYDKNAPGAVALDYTALGVWCYARQGRVLVHERQGAEWLPFLLLTSHARSGRTTAGRVRFTSEVLWSR